MSVSVRDATSADYTAFTRLFPALGVPDPLLTPAQFEAQMLPCTVVADDERDTVAYAHWRFYGPTAHVVHVVVDERARGRGVGRALMAAVRERVASTAATRWYLNVKKDNAAAIRLYGRSGLVVESRGWAVRADWSKLLALPEVGDAVPFDATAAEVSELAARLGIDAERLALVRARPGHLFVAQRNESEGCAFGVFDPAFPGIYPLGVAHPSYARPLFAAIHRYARTEHVNVFVEGNAGLAEVILGTGATLTFELLRMGAALVRS